MVRHRRFGVLLGCALVALAPGTAAAADPNGPRSGERRSIAGLEMDMTVVRERIYHEAGAPTPEGMTFHEIIRLIRDAGRRPVERDALYNEIREW